MSLLKGAMPVIGRASLYLKKYSPELLLGTGLVGFVATNVLSSKATLKLDRELEKMKDELDDIKEVAYNLADRMEDEKVYSDTDYKLDLTRAYLKFSFKITKMYTPAIVVGGLSIAALLGSHTIMRNRNIALMAAYQTVSAAYSNYRDLIREKFGSEEEMAIRAGVKEVDVETSETDKDGKEVKKNTKELISCKDPSKTSPYARFFDEHSVQWEKDPTYNLAYLTAQQSYFNDMLKARGHVFLNEVYDALGIPRTKAGQIVGWVISKDGDNFIDFGIYDLDNPSGRAFVNGLERSILLDFNVDGVIYDKIDKDL